ncbi:ribonuclease H-like domain-containing protein [Tanacetum coccineum]
MTETLVLGRGTSGNKSSRESLRLGNWIKIARAVTSKEDMTSQEILHRKIKRVKFNSAIIIPSKLTRRNKVFNDVRSDKNTMEIGALRSPPRELRNKLKSVQNGVNWFDQIDSDGSSVVEVNQMLKCLGYLNPKMEYWYKMPDKDALLSLSNDNDVLRFIKYVDRYKLMQLYVVHPVDKPKLLGDNEVTEETFDPLFCDLDLETGEPNATEFHSEVPNVTEPSEVPNGPEPSEIPNDAEHSDGSDESEDSDDSDFDVELEDMIRNFKGIVPTFSNDDGSQFGPNGPSGPSGSQKSKARILKKGRKPNSKPDTTIKIDVERTVDVTSETRKLKRIYVCLGALKSGFKAVGVDPNNGTYPLAYAVVEAETKDFWNWGQQYKELLWKSATSPTVQLFERNIEELRMINKDVYDWLKKIPPHHCPSHQLLVVQKVINKSNGPLTPTATKIFNNIKKEAAQITVLWNGGELYQATGPHSTQYVCNMTQRTCSCKKWELTRIPCKHAVACIWDMVKPLDSIPGITNLRSWV